MASSPKKAPATLYKGKPLVRSGNVQGVVEKDFYGRVNAPLRAVNNKVIVAGEEEVARNPRSRSAKLRVAQRV